MKFKLANQPTPVEPEVELNFGQTPNGKGFYVEAARGGTRVDVARFFINSQGKLFLKVPLVTSSVAAHLGIEEVNNHILFSVAE